MLPQSRKDEGPVVKPSDTDQSLAALHLQILDNLLDLGLDFMALLNKLGGVLPKSQRLNGADPRHLFELRQLLIDLLKKFVVESLVSAVEKGAVAQLAELCLGGGDVSHVLWGRALEVVVAEAAAGGEQLSV